jgi:YidC/Oxa1 family membrane protein insertase
MDWKIVVGLVIALGAFFVFQQCSDDVAPDYDQLRTQEKNQRQQKLNQEKQLVQKKIEQEAIDVAVKTRGKRPAPRAVSLETDDFKAIFNTRGGSLTSFALKNPQYVETPRDWNTGVRIEDAEELVPIDLVTTRTELSPKLEEKNYAWYEINQPLRFDIYEGIPSLLSKTDYYIVDQSDHSLTFRYKQPNTPVVITKKFELDKNSNIFQLWLTATVTNISDSKVAFRSSVVQQGYQHVSEAGGGMMSKQPNLLNGICRYGDTLERRPWNDEDWANQPFSGIGNISFVGVETNYFLNAMIPADDTPASCRMSTRLFTPPGGPSNGEGVIRAELRYAEIELQPGQSKTFRVKNYLGPKRFQVLQQVGNHLEESVDFGMLAPICRLLLIILFFFQKFVINWGLSIILLTLVVKVALMPLTHQSFKSADRMKALKPEVDKLNEKFKDDAQAKQKATMGLYKKHKVNPLGGCIPSLVQMPIWISLYWTLRASPELYRAPFFGWITDLSSPDPFFVTPVLMGAAMFLQQRFTPMAGDNAQAKMMMYFMPIMFSGMMLFLPSGLTLYILVNTVLSIFHQVFIHRRASHAVKAVSKKGK